MHSDVLQPATRKSMRTSTREQPSIVHGFVEKQEQQRKEQLQHEQKHKDEEEQLLALGQSEFRVRFVSLPSTSFSCLSQLQH